MDGIECVCIDTNPKNKTANPELISCISIIEAFAAGKAQLVDNGLTNLHPYEGFSTLHQQEYRDKVWSIIEPLVKNPQIFDLRERGKLIKKRAKESKLTPKVILKYLRRYWQGGQIINALFSNYYKCGGQGKTRQSTPDVKRGKPNEATIKRGQRVGINVDEKVREKFRLGIETFYLNQQGMTLKKAYDETIRLYFNIGSEIRDGKVYYILPPKRERPSERQFRYWYYQELQFSKAIILRKGENAYNRNHRPLTGNATAQALGPGSIFEIDSTVGDIYLVSRFDRNRFIGRPVIYMIKDVFSRLITGFGVTLYGPSYETAMIALENMLRDKVEFCREYEVNILPHHWPSHHRPLILRADRGEMLSKNSDTIVQNLGIEIDQTPPYRPDWKPVIERHFRLMNDIVINWLPGVNHKRERGERESRYDACLTLYEFRKILITFILEYNLTHRLNEYPLTLDMLEDSVKPYPIALWDWGVKNRQGILRPEARHIARLGLLPRGMASTTERGVRYGGADYRCDYVMSEEWSVRGQGVHRRPVPICYDPRDMNIIYLLLNGGQQLEPAYLTNGDEIYSKCEWQEYLDNQSVRRMG